MSHYNNKIILVGGSGFIGSNLKRYLEYINEDFESLSSTVLNLVDLKDNSKLKEFSNCKNCSFVFLSALTPDKGKNIDTFNSNIKMAQNFVENIDDSFSDDNHIIYISSDAVYPLSLENIMMNSPSEPTDLYSSMHLTREIIFKEKFKKNLTILRPTLIYGFGDTHNSYGPNRFFNQTMEKKEINIFGEGLDTRDHLYITDLCKMIYKIIDQKIMGTFNLASGTSISYIDLANLFKKIFPDVNINKIPVSNKKTIRSFDISNFLKKIDFEVSDLEKNLHEYANLLDIK